MSKITLICFMCGILTYLDDWVILRVNVGTVKILYMEYNGTSVQSYIPRPSNDTFICVSILFCSCCGFSLVCKKLLFCRKNARGGSFLPHCQLDLLQFLNLRLFCTFLRIFAAFLRKFSLELVSHQSKQFLFSVELG